MSFEHHFIEGLNSENQAQKEREAAHKKAILLLKEVAVETWNIGVTPSTTSSFEDKTNPKTIIGIKTERDRTKIIAEVVYKKNEKTLVVIPASQLDTDLEVSVGLDEKNLPETVGTALGKCFARAKRR